MPSYKFIGFRAVGKDENNKQYNCSYYVSFPLIAGVTQEGLNQAIAFAHQQAKEYHPTIQVIGQMERTVNV